MHLNPLQLNIELIFLKKDSVKSRNNPTIITKQTENNFSPLNNSKRSHLKIIAMEKAINIPKIDSQRVLMRTLERRERRERERDAREGKKSRN